jgi:hypothetical protein
MTDSPELLELLEAKRTTNHQDDEWGTITHKSVEPHAACNDFVN